MFGKRKVTESERKKEREKEIKGEREEDKRRKRECTRVPVGKNLH